MLEAIRRLMAGLGGQATPEFSDDDHRLASAALLVHVACADGVFDNSEHRHILALLSAGYGLSTDNAERLIVAAKERDRQEIDFHHFVSVLKRALPAAAHLRLISMMYEIAYADGVLHEFEDDAIGRVAELLEVPAGDVETVKRMATASGDEK